MNVPIQVVGEVASDLEAQDRGGIVGLAFSIHGSLQLEHLTLLGALERSLITGPLA